MEAARCGSTEFESWRSYRDFHREVAKSWRYVRSEKAQKFLDAVANSSHSLAKDIPAEHLFYRAQVAHHSEWDPEIGDGIPGPALPSRMVPLRDRATEGRVNPKGIPCLYLAKDQHTAIAEARPWIGSLVSLGVFRTVRSLKIVDCTSDLVPFPFYFEEPSVEDRAQAVWNDIVHAFREPVTRDDNVADYAATQIIAEIFRAEEFEGIAYRSAFGTDRYNIALFDLNAVEQVKCSLYEVRGVKLE